MKTLRLLSLIGLLVACAGADWRQFRGSDTTAVADRAVPEQFGPDQNIAWKIELPDRGLSSPIIVGERVFLTVSGGRKQDQLHVLAFEVRTGHKLWQRSFWGTGPTAAHPKTCMAAPTPASDGERLVALFGTDDLVCLDLDGNVLWVRALYEEHPGATDGRGLATSPVIAGDTVVVQIDTQNVSFATGIDLRNGATRWHMDRPREVSWSTPILLPGMTAAQPLVFLQGGTRLSAIDPMTGREVWGLERAGNQIASSVLAGNVLYVPGDDKGLAAFQLSADAAPPKLLWQKPKLNPGFSSPVVLGERIYVLRGPILVAGDVKTGEVLGQLRLKGSYSSSLVSAGGLIYCFSEEGLANVIKPGVIEPVLLGSSKFGEAILCTPALADGALYVRSDKHLWKIAKTTAAPAPDGASGRSR